MVQSFKDLWWSISEKTHFGLKHHFPLIFRGPNSAHPEVFRHAMQLYKFQLQWATTFLCKGPNAVDMPIGMIKVVWWSEKTHFGLKHHFPLNLEGQTQHTLKFSGVPIAMVHVSKLYDDPCVWENTFWAKTSLSFIFRGQNSAHPEVFRQCQL